MATCEYEMLRQQKIADNRKRMESLGLQKVRAVSKMGSHTSADRRTHSEQTLSDLLFVYHLISLF